MKFIYLAFEKRTQILYWLVILCLWLQGDLTSLLAQTFSRDVRIVVSVNQVGYTPWAAKRAVMPGTTSVEFEVRRLPSNEVVYRGTMNPSMNPVGRDFGDHLVGGFSEVTTQGTYYITTSSGRSYPFRVSRTVYEDAMDRILFYLAQQRCGPSTTGYLAPCHLDDAIRQDDGQRQDVTGGWHDASDLRKGVESILSGAVGLVNVFELEPHWHRARMLDELRWGNQYFLKMQEPARLRHARHG